MHILVTRPKGKGESLSQQLVELGHSVVYQPMLEIVQGPDCESLPTLFEVSAPDMLIFISASAVRFFKAGFVDAKRLKSSGTALLAVGESTAGALANWVGQPVAHPTVETSEGLLAMPELQPGQMKGKKIVIVRGVGGRELLFERLQSLSAQVNYWEVYQRVAVTAEGPLWFERWRDAQIDCIVATSVDILTAIFECLPVQAEDWLRTRRWIVASARIAAKAAEMGIAPELISDARGAKDQAIVAQVQRLIEN